MALTGTAPAAERIYVALGDSVAAGVGAAEGHGFVERCHRYLRDPACPLGRNLRVIVRRLRAALDDDRGRETLQLMQYSSTGGARLEPSLARSASGNPEPTPPTGVNAPGRKRLGHTEAAVRFRTRGPRLVVSRDVGYQTHMGALEVLVLLLIVAIPVAAVLLVVRMVTRRHDR